jgi:hypothetical protein
MWRQLLGPRPHRPGRPLLRKPKTAATRTGVVEPLISRGIKVQKVAEVLTIPGYREPQGKAVAASAQPATGRAQGRLNSGLRGVSFGAITGVRDHLRRSSRLGTACRVRRLRGHRRQGDDHPLRRTARSGRPLGAVGADHGIRARTARTAPGGRSIRYIKGWEWRAGITRGIAGGAAFPAPSVCRIDASGRGEGAEVDANQRSSWWMAASSAAYARTSAARSSGSSGLSGRHPSRTH